jgi:hypothetical protein
MAEEAKAEHGQRREAAKDKVADRAQGAKDKAAAKVAEMREKAQEVGFFGNRPEQPDNEEYSIQTGPDSPTAFDAAVASREADIEDLKASVGDNDGGEA